MCQPNEIEVSSDLSKRQRNVDGTSAVGGEKNYRRASLPQLI